MEAYGLSNNSPQTSLKRRVQVDDITVGVKDIGYEYIVNSMKKAFTMPVLHGAPTEYEVCTEWDAVEEFEPISSCIGQQCIQMEVNILTDWNVDALMQEPKAAHLIEIDSITSDSVYTHVTINDKICCAQINVMTESLFKHIGKINKLPLYPNSDVKLVGYSYRNIEYIGTTVVDVAHLTQTKKATFYVSKLYDDKVILGLHLCIDLQLLSIHCDDKHQCKSQILHETKKIGSEFPIGVDLQHIDTQDVLPPVPISTKLEGDMKQQIMDLYPDVKPGAVPVVCSSLCVPHTVQPKLKEELDRMLKLGIIRKLDINEASHWVHTLVIVIKPNGKLHVCLDPRTLNSVLQQNVHNAKRFVDIISKEGFYTGIQD